MLFEPRLPFWINVHAQWLPDPRWLRPESDVVLGRVRLVWRPINEIPEGDHVTGHLDGGQWCRWQHSYSLRASCPTQSKTAVIDPNARSVVAVAAPERFWNTGWTS